MLGGNKKNTKNKATGRSGGGNTFIDNACKITGDVASKGSITIDGLIEGNVNADATVLVTENGSIVGNVTCNELIVFGNVDGNISSQTLHLQPTSKITGDVNTQNLHVESGAIYQGAVSMHKNAADTSKSITNNSSNTVLSNSQTTQASSGSHMVVDAVHVANK